MMFRGEKHKQTTIIIQTNQKTKRKEKKRNKQNEKKKRKKTDPCTKQQVKNTYILLNILKTNSHN